MAEESVENAPVSKKRGPKSRAEIEAEIREQIEAETRAAVEEQVRAELAAEREAQRKRDELASAAAGRVSPVSGFEISGDPQAEGSVTIHFVDDGFTVLGKVWYRGEELTLVPGTEQWELAPKYQGKIFAALDEFEQEAIWGRRFFRDGPWRGLRLDQIEDPELTEDERAALRKAQQIREEKYGAVLGGQTASAPVKHAVGISPIATR